MEKQEIIEQLKVKGKEQLELFEKARNIRKENFGERAVVRGVVEITDACVVDCDYCPMRKSNRYNRYIMSSDEIIEASRPIKESGLKVVFLQGGEIPATTRRVGEAIPKIRKFFKNDVEILLCLGNKTKEEYSYLKEQGADSYILKHETSDPSLHKKLRHTSLDSRLKCLQDLLDLEYKVGTGTIVGLPRQTLNSLADDILLPKKYGTHMTSCSPLIPAKDTPLENYSSGDISLTLNTIALMRIVNPKTLIPSVSAIEKIRSEGQLEGLNAGANVITINYTPERERNKYSIYGKDRFIVQKNYALRILEKAGLIYQ